MKQQGGDMKINFCKSKYKLLFRITTVAMLGQGQGWYRRVLLLAGQGNMVVILKE